MTIKTSMLLIKRKRIRILKNQTMKMMMKKKKMKETDRSNKMMKMMKRMLILCPIVKLRRLKTFPAVLLFS